MRDNTITAHVGDKAYVKTDPAFQYDHGLILIIDGVTLPEEYDVQFGNTNSAANKTVVGGANGVAIPDEYLRNGEDIHAYLYMHTSEDDGFSVYHIHIPVMNRAAIDEEEITPIEHRAIEKALEALAEAVDETEANVREYPYINDEKYWMVYDAEQGEFVDTGVKAEGENNFDLEVGTVTTLPPGADATASVTWEGDTAKLNLGLPSGDASSLVSVHDVRADSDDITIYDGADNLAVDDIRIKLFPIQDGSGVPSTQNIRRISGVYGETLVHVVGEDATTYNTSFEDSAGVVYSGMFYPLTGKLIVDRVLVTKRCVDMNNVSIQPGWRDSGIKEIVGEGVSQVFYDQTLNVGTSFGVDTTGDNDLLYLGYDEYHMRQSDWIATEITVQICVPLAEPIEYTFDPYTPTVQLGENTYFVSAGKIDYLRYPCDTKLYVNETVDNSGYYTLPDSGIPVSDLSNGVTSMINAKVDASQKGVANGVAELDQNGMVPSQQLPSYVDDVLEYNSINYFPQYGEKGKIYVALDTNKTYRWGGTRYVEISESLALGETSTTAYRGDRGAEAYAAAVTNVETTPTQNSGNLITSGAVYSGLSGKYEKPSGGIPSTDLASGVQTSLGLADTAYQKPNGGIPSTDLASGVIPTVPVQDVQIVGASVLSQGVANVPLADSSNAGVAKVNSNYGIQMTRANSSSPYEILAIQMAGSSDLKSGSNYYKPVVPASVHQATFYGLAKASGDTTQSSSSNPVGTYTDEAKSAIRSMIGAENGDDIIKVQDTQPTTPATKIWMPETAPAGIQVPTYAEHQALNQAINAKYTKPSTGIPASDLASGVIPSVPVQDVQLGGTSILSQGVANVPKASESDLGVVGINSSFGIDINASGKLYISGASSNGVKGGTGGYRPLTPDLQHASAFYGLAKAAGADMASLSSVTVGQYPEAQKSAISDMLNAPETVSGTTPTITAKSGVRYVCGEVSTLTIVAPASGCIDVVFESGSTPTVLTVTPPTGISAIKWAGGFDPSSLDANTTYEINILDGEFGVVGKWT